MVLYIYLQMRGIQRPACFHTRKALSEELIEEENSKVVHHNLDLKEEYATIVTRIVGE